MPISYDQNMLREIIMDNYQNPRNFKEVYDKDYITIHMDHSDNCIDDIYVQVKIENDKIVSCFWHGKACAISTASTSIMTELVIGKTIEEAKKIMAEFDKMMDNKEFDSDLLEDAVCFINTYRQPSRINCATIGWRGLDEAFKEVEKEEKNGK